MNGIYYLLNWLGFYITGSKNIRERKISVIREKKIEKRGEESISSRFTLFEKLSRIEGVVYALCIHEDCAHFGHVSHGKLARDCPYML